MIFPDWLVWENFGGSMCYTWYWAICTLRVALTHKNSTWCWSIQQWVWTFVSGNSYQVTAAWLSQSYQALDRSTLRSGKASRERGYLKHRLKPVALLAISVSCCYGSHLNLLPCIIMIRFPFNWEAWVRIPPTPVLNTKMHKGFVKSYGGTGWALQGIGSRYTNKTFLNPREGERLKHRPRKKSKSWKT